MKIKCAKINSNGQQCTNKVDNYKSNSEYYYRSFTDEACRFLKIPLRSYCCQVHRREFNKNSILKLKKNQSVKAKRKGSIINVKPINSIVKIKIKPTKVFNIDANATLKHSKKIKSKYNANKVNANHKKAISNGSNVNFKSSKNSTSIAAKPLFKTSTTKTTKTRTPLPPHVPQVKSKSRNTINVRILEKFLPKSCHIAQEFPKILVQILKFSIFAEFLYKHFFGKFLVNFFLKIKNRDFRRRLVLERNVALLKSLK